MLHGPFIGIVVDLQQAILRDADRCVLCGICLPYCPTYLQTGNEAESPRGRISLMLAMARGQLEASPALIGHLDTCLTCRACETKCPSEVPYGRLIGNARRLIARHHRSPLRARLLATTVSHARLLKHATGVAQTRVGAMVLRWSRLRHLHQLFAPTDRKQDHMDAVLPALRGRVALFTGCTGEALESETIAAAKALLRLAGFAVETPEGQGCCGAMHHHMGDSRGMERRAQANLTAFSAEGFNAVVFIASGCGAMLKEYGEWLDDERAAPFAEKCVEITDFLANQGFPESVRFGAMEQRVALHLPCTQANVLKTAGATERLLKQIPGIALDPLPDNHLCCGAAGSHMFLHADTARALREPKMKALERRAACYLVTTNIGCALHLASGASERGIDVEVVHPVALLARQLVRGPGEGLVADTESD